MSGTVARPQARSGAAQALAEICVDRGYQRLEWWVLDWNEPSIGFYASIGAEAMDEWTASDSTVGRWSPSDSR